MKNERDRLERKRKRLLSSSQILEMETIALSVSVCVLSIPKRDNFDFSFFLVEKLLFYCYICCRII